jgi:DNA (cytosine-5)-methyltransferase 1
MWFSEIEPFPCAVLKQRFPDVPNLGDMTKIRVETLENGNQVFYSGDGESVVVPEGIDLLVGGTPCQSFSVAGGRAGLEGESGLARTFVDLLKHIHPQWFIWENVPGCISSRSNGGVYDFNFLLASFAECGYTCAWRILDAQYVRVDGYPYAVPQRRRRVFVVGCLGEDWRRPAKVLFEPTGLLGSTPPSRTERKPASGSAGDGTEGTSSYVITPSGEDVADTLDASYYKGCGSRNGKERTIVCCYENHANDSRVKPMEGVCQTLSSRRGTGGGNVPLVQEVILTDKPAVRRMTPVECERLMGFPDNWTRIAWRGKDEDHCPDNHRYKACGNSMCVNVMRWIGMRISNEHANWYIK